MIVAQCHFPKKMTLAGSILMISLLLFFTPVAAQTYPNEYTLLRTTGYLDTVDYISSGGYLYDYYSAYVYSGSSYAIVLDSMDFEPYLVIKVPGETDSRHITARSYYGPAASVLYPQESGTLEIYVYGATKSDYGEYYLDLIQTSDPYATLRRFEW